ncbi:MAG: hypothetical protein AAGE01_00340 [Pseudomonadota bacterium]
MSGGVGTAEATSKLDAFGGVRGIVAMVAIVAAMIGYRVWERGAAADALGMVADELGLTAVRNGRHSAMNGQIDGVGVSVRTLSERSGGTDFRNYTDFVIQAPRGPSGRIVPASLRELTIGGVSGDERVVSGDAAFDESVIVSAMEAATLTALGADGRAAVVAATDAGWELERYRWKARMAGHLTDAQRIETILELGLAAERSLREANRAGR